MYYYIINPAAGGGKINKIQEKLKERLRELGIAGEFEKSTGTSDIPKLTKIAIDRGFKTIVAVGGDGTINEMINAVENKANVALGIIPMGTTNELANLLGIHDWQSACTILAARKVEKMDLGRINDQYFVTSANIGIDNILFEVNKNQKNSAFARGVFNLNLSREIRKFKPVKIELEIDGKYQVSTDCNNLAITNGIFLEYLPQRSEPQDGTLDVIMLSGLNHREALSFGQNRFKFNRDNAGRFSVFHTKSVTVRSNEKKPVAVTADGQVVAETPVTITVSDKKLNVIVSRRRKF